jgi:PBP1b-binding outer membrane lipoprotein LpoB
MKKTNLLLSLLIGIMLFTACKSDDDSSEPENQSKFTVNGTEYLTPNGYILSYFEDPFNSSHAIYLINGTILNNE